MKFNANKTISILTAGLVALLALAAFVLSYNALKAMAAGNGIGGWQAYIWPLLIDCSLIVFSLAVLRASLHGERTRYAWTLVGLYTVATVSFNVLHAPGNLTAQVIAAVAPVSLFLSFELLMSQVKNEVSRHGLILSLTELRLQVSQVDAELVHKMDQGQKLAAEVEQKMNQVKALQAEMNSLEKSKNEPLRANEDDTGQRVKRMARQTQVLKLLNSGMSQKQVADELDVSLSTVKRDALRLNGSVIK